MEKLYLRVGDQVLHQRYLQWGIGVVTEQRSSVMVGGTCIVRIIFKDGIERSFINDLDNYSCCYYAGVQIQEAATDVDIR